MAFNKKVRNAVPIPRSIYILLVAVLVTNVAATIVIINFIFEANGL